VSEIGRPVNDPELADVELRLATDLAGDGLDPSVRAIVVEELAQLDDLREALLDGRASVY
jgi:S-adenosylmethionine synthetase